MSVTIREVAKLSRVSETTVSLAFQKDSRITDKTRDRVFAAAKRLNYVPNSAARDLRHGATRTVGFLVNDIGNPFYASMVQVAERTARALGFQLLTVDSGWLAERETAVVEQLLQNRVRGVLLASNEKSDRGLELLRAAHTPLIAVDTCPQGFAGARVVNDLERAGELAAEHLAEMGCRRLAFLTAAESDASFSAFVALRRGFEQTAVRLTAKAQVVHAGLTVAAGQTAARTLLTQTTLPDGIFCANDLCAYGVIEAADAHGVRVGRDIAVMGIDDLETSALSRLSLTSIRQPVNALVQTAVTALIDAIEHDKQPIIKKTLQPELIARASTRAKGER
jgi:LacI family transcriptional regulator